MARLARELKHEVEAIAFPEGRMVGSEGHEKAKCYLLGRMEELELEPYDGSALELPYTHDGEEFANLVGVVPGKSPSAEPVVIGAHYDSAIPAPSADDNAAAVAIALATAKLLQKRRLQRDVVIAIFDAEEPWHFLGPSMGSIRFYEDHAHKRGVHAALIMDMVGHDVVVPLEMLDLIPWLGRLARWLPRIGTEDAIVPGVRDLFFMTGAESHPNLAGVVDSVAMPWRLRLIPTLNEYVGDLSDHSIFRTNGVPYLFLSCGRWRHYHAKTDTPEKLNYRKMARLSGYLAALTEALAAETLPLHNGEPADTAAFEIRRIQKACGPALPYLLRWLGITKLEDRSHITALASRLMRMGL